MGPRHSIRGRVAFSLITLSVLGVAGCGGGMGGGGQDSDPVVVDYPVAYVKRPLVANRQADLGDPTAFIAGGDLYVRDRAASTAVERNVTYGLTHGAGDVRDLEPAYDGRTLLFSMRLPDPDRNDDEVPTWNIWEYSFVAGTLRRVIPSDIDAEAGEDLAPHYLPDGRIVFSSTRQRQSKAVLLDEGKPQFPALDEDRQEHGLTLHVMNADGGNIHQITFNQSHDLDPAVLSSGRIVFTRWDHMSGRNEMNLYTVRPDGTDLQLLYGAHSHDTGTANRAVHFTQPRPMPDGRVVALIRPITAEDGGGDIVIINTDSYVDNTEPTASHAGAAGPGQIRATVNDVHTDGTPSPGGRFASAYPLDDGTSRLLVAWSLCRVMEHAQIVPCTAERLAATEVQEAPPFYGLWLYDFSAQRQLPVVTAQEGIAIAEAVVVQERPRPPVLFDRSATGDLDTDAAADGLGILHIRSVYDMDGAFYNFGMSDTASTRLENLVTSDPLGLGAIGLTPNNRRLAYLADPAQFTGDDRPARFLRLVKAVSIPDRYTRNVPNHVFGVSAANGMREILGYVPIEPDGSVKVKVPANVAFTIDVLDKNGRRISARHRNWMQLRPGETLVCNGCHTHNVANGANPKPHGRNDAQPASINRGALATGVAFPHTIPTLVDAGQNMAETRFHQPGVKALPTVDLTYQDYWTDAAAAGRPADAAFSITYRDAFDYDNAAVLKPVEAGCIDSWSPHCRVVIDYERHIHPLWSKTRTNVCTACHTTNSNTQVPAGQIDLTDGGSDVNAARFKSYHELLSADLQQELSATGTLQNVQRQATNAMGEPLFDTDGNPIMEDDPTATVVPSMSTQGARASRFFTLFATGGGHSGWLTDAELKLLAEWLDDGAQYFNDPFHAPVN